jgi:23S rRNA pseudouridine1911/1915/1917 synthase
VCHPVGRKRYNTLMNALHARYRHPEDPARDVIPRLCHRLDKDTSGLLLVALAPGVRRRMQWIFESKTVVKEYLAIVEGLWERDYDEVDLPIGRATGHIRIARAVDLEGGLPARTIVCVEERFPPAAGDRGFTLVRCSPVTGRQHQIRVHAAARGHPVFGDNMYGSAGLDWEGFPAGAPVVKRQCLHAHRIQFPHPATGAELDLRAPLPADMQALIEHLRARAPARP